MKNKEIEARIQTKKGLQYNVLAKVKVGDETFYVTDDLSCMGVLSGNRAGFVHTKKDMLVVVNIKDVDKAFSNTGKLLYRYSFFSKLFR